MSFRERESIDMLMLLRIIVERLDQHLASQLNSKGVVELVARQTFVKPSRVNSAIIKQRVQTLNGILERDFGYSSPSNEVEPVVRSVGVV